MCLIKPKHEDGSFFSDTKIIDFESSMGHISYFCKKMLKTNECESILENICVYHTMGKEYSSLLDTLVQKIEKIIGEKSSSAIKVKVSHIFYLFKQFNKCIENKRESIEFYLPERDDDKFIKFMQDMLNKDHTYYEKNRDNICFVLIGVCCSILCKMKNDGLIGSLKKYDQEFRTSSQFYNKDLSVIENIRHSFGHSDVGVQIMDDMVFLENKKGGMSTTVSKKEFVEDYVSIIQDINNEINCSDDHGIKVIHTAMMDITGKDPIKDWVVTTLFLSAGIGSLFETKYEKSQSIMDQITNYILTNCRYGIASTYFSLPCTGGSIEMRLFRNSILHGDFSWDRSKQEMTYYHDRRSNKSFVVDWADLAIDFNVFSLILELPVLLCCIYGLYEENRLL